jgi:hypothetical protein
MFQKERGLGVKEKARVNHQKDNKYLLKNAQISNKISLGPAKRYRIMMR